MHWNDQQVEELRNGWEVMSASQLAAKIGTTRSAIIGKAHRIGLKAKAKAGGQKTMRPAPRVRHLPTVSRNRLAIMSLEEVFPPLIDEAPALIENGGRVTLEALRPHHCRFPIGDKAPYLFCGNDIVKGSYCAAHGRLVVKRT